MVFIQLLLILSNFDLENAKSMPPPQEEEVDNEDRGSTEPNRRIKEHVDVEVTRFYLNEKRVDEEENTNTSGREKVKRQFQGYTIETSNYERSGEDDNDQVDTEDIHVRPREHNTRGEGEDGHSGDRENSGEMERDTDSRRISPSGSGEDTSGRPPYRKTKLKTNEAEVDSKPTTTLPRTSMGDDIFIEETKSKPKEYQVQIRESSGIGDSSNSNPFEGPDDVSKLDQYVKVSGGHQKRKLLSLADESKENQEESLGRLTQELSDEDVGTEESVSQKGFDQVFRAKDFAGGVLQCNHPELTGAIMNGSLVYLRTSCRLCLCLSGDLQCEPKSATCPDSSLSSQSCQLQNEQLVPHGSLHHDGCNSCRCRSGNFLCTRIRCRSAGLHYTNYKLNITKEESNLEAIGIREGTKSERWNDACLECDFEPAAPVCGPNWKTYRTLCHAQFCGGFHIDDVQMDACEDLVPCQNSFCPGGTVCVAHRRGPCLASKSRDGKIIECHQYKCFLKTTKCDIKKSGPEDTMCGEDGTTYPDECAMHHGKAGVPVSLAYQGPCKPACTSNSKRSAKVCGVDGTNKGSPCEALMFHSHIDYHGECEPVHARPILVQDPHRPEQLENTMCSKINENNRCPEPECDQTVIPEGNCCPVCAAALSIRLDTSVQDITDIQVLPYDPDLNTVKPILDEVERYQQHGILTKCAITADLTDTNDISIIFTPVKPRLLEECEEAARRTHRWINSQHEGHSMALNLMAVAALIEPENFISSDANERVRRSIRHDHEQMYTNSSAVYVHRGKHSTMVLTRVLPWCLAYFLSYW